MSKLAWIRLVPGQLCATENQNEDLNRSLPWLTQLIGRRSTVALHNRILFVYCDVVTRVLESAWRVVLRSSVTVELQCVACFNDTLHTLAYAGRILLYVKCHRCGAVMRQRVVNNYLVDLASRIRSKPNRVLRELRDTPRSLAFSLPFRTVVKPREITAEISGVFAASKRSRCHWADRGSANG